MTYPYAYYNEHEFDYDVPDDDLAADYTCASADIFIQTLKVADRKISIPLFDQIFPDTKLNNVLRRSAETYAGTMITGRAGTGKTTAALTYASRYQNVAWYTVEPPDINWRVFSQCFTRSIEKTFPQIADIYDSGYFSDSDHAIAEYLTQMITLVERSSDDDTAIVIDDLHNVFDADWFPIFLNQLLYSLTPSTHLLLVCRSKPSMPLWRLRSKQLLNVIDEKLLAVEF